MAVFRCKMCGAVLQINGQTVAECEYCGAQQTLPRIDDERREQMYDRANHFRRNNEFDKAMAIYEQILIEENTDAEAYWSLVLCNYGIEYVEDPTSYKRVPTVNRAQFTSVFDDDNYKFALKYADAHQKAIYQNEARAINEIQKGILSISQKEEPFDVFICYKETDQNGQRTSDSVLAADLYNELTREGFKVFFSRITLEDKLGTAYEPYIFAALNSSKVMVVLGTKLEHFNAVWVKNEWSRYLALIKNGARKMLIPAFKDMAPYDLPQEFSHLQAQDMSKLGFMQDLVRGIKKIVDAQTPRTTVVKETVISEGNINIATLLKRVFMFLEDGDWTSANEYCEKVLDNDPECAEAYLGKLMAALRVRKQSDFKNLSHPFEGNNNFQKAIRFANEDLKNTLNGYIEYIKSRNEKERLDNIYSQARTMMLSAESEAQYKSAAGKFNSIYSYMDSAALAQECYAKAEEMRLENERRLEIAKQEARKRAKRNRNVGIVLVAAAFICMFVILLIAVIIPNARYNNAIELIDDEEYVEAYEILTDLDGYRDSLGIANSIYDEYKHEKLQSAKVGDYVVFGAYEQDSGIEYYKDEIEWIVLDKKDGRVLLISKYALENYRYNDSNTIIDWENCSLRWWLNGPFINEAFSETERAKIVSVTVSDDQNSQHDINLENAIQDKVFLLSLDEAEKYFDSDSARQCKPTAHAIANGAHKDDDNGNCCWWLQTPGEKMYYAACVSVGGRILDTGYPVAESDIAIRPAIWVELD